jgi:O-antigen ligase
MFVVGFCLIGWAHKRGIGPAGFNFLGLGFIVAALFYLFELISWGWLTRTLQGFEWRDILDDSGGIPVMSYLINGAVIISLFMWPAIALFVSRGRRGAAAVLFGSVVALTILFGSDSGMIAIVVGVLVWLGARWCGATFVKILAAFFVIVTVATPFVFSRVLTTETVNRVVNEMPSAPNSALVRLMIWKFATEKIMERPLLGWGFDAARRIPGGGDRFVIRDAAGRFVTAELNLPLHSHNQILQIWLELGAVGALIVALTGAAIIVRTASLPPLARESSLALATSVVVVDCLSYGAWQSWWIAVVFLAAALQASANANLNAKHAGRTMLKI